MTGVRFIADTYEAPEGDEALDAYSRAVISVAQRLTPSVANLRVSRRVRGGRRLDGGGSAVVITPDGFMLTSAHVIERTDGGRASAVDGVGLGLAVPINQATRTIVGALMTEGRFRRAYLGIAGGSRPLPPRVATRLGRESGVEVVEVLEGSPAARAGLRPEDLILELNGVPVATVDDVQRLMVGELIGSQVHARVLREGSERELDLVPVELVG